MLELDPETRRAAVSLAEAFGWLHVVDEKVVRKYFAQRFLETVEREWDDDAIMLKDYRAVYGPRPLLENVIQKGVAQLLQHQSSDGSWTVDISRATQTQAHLENTCLAISALRTSGRAPSSSIERGLGYIGENAGIVETDKIGDVVASALLAALPQQDVSSPIESERLRHWVAQLLEMQFGDGSWWGEPDVTARAVEVLSAYGIGKGAVVKGRDFLCKSRKSDGSWRARRSSSFLLGTYMALKALAPLGIGEREAIVARAGKLLRDARNADGGWGEVAAHDRTGLTIGESNVLHTSWAVLGLLATGDNFSSAVRAGVEYLVSQQLTDGKWSSVISADRSCLPPEEHLAVELLAFPILALSTFVKSSPDESIDQILTAKHEPVNKNPIGVAKSATSKSFDATADGKWLSDERRK